MPQRIPRWQIRENRKGIDQAAEYIRQLMREGLSFDYARDHAKARNQQFGFNSLALSANSLAIAAREAAQKPETA